MAENNNIEVGGRLHSIATGNVLTGANEILDDTINKKQSEINSDLYSKYNGLNGEDYITYNATGETSPLPSEGESNKIYRVGNWNGDGNGTTPETYYNVNYFTEYTWNGTSYVILSIVNRGIDNNPTSGSNNLITSGGIYNQISPMSLKLERATIEEVAVDLPSIAPNQYAATKTTIVGKLGWGFTNYTITGYGRIRLLGLVMAGSNADNIGWCWLNSVGAVIDGQAFDTNANATEDVLKEYIVTPPTNAVQIRVNWVGSKLTGNFYMYLFNMNPAASMTDVMEASHNSSGGYNLTKNGVNQATVIAQDPSVDRTNIPLVATNSNVALVGDGTVKEENGFEVRKYAVTAGDTLYLKLSKDTGVDCVCQWQNTASASISTWTNCIAAPVMDAIDGCVIVPQYATYLFVCCVTGNTANKVQKCTNIRDVESGNDIHITESLLSHNLIIDKGGKVSFIKQSYEQGTISKCLVDGGSATTKTDIKEISLSDTLLNAYAVNFTTNEANAKKYAWKRGLFISDGAYYTQIINVSHDKYYYLKTYIIADKASLILYDVDGNVIDITNNNVEGYFKFPENVHHIIVSALISNWPYVVIEKVNIADYVFPIEKINGLGATLNDLQENKVDVKTVNLVNPDYIENNKGIFIQDESGQIRTLEDNSISGYIPVNGKNIVSNGFNNNTYWGHTVYDANKVKIRVFNSSSYTYQEGDAYVRFTFNPTTTSVNEQMANYGNTLEDFQPYNPISGYLIGEDDDKSIAGKCQIATGKTFSTGSYQSEIEAQPIINNQGNYYIDYKEVTKPKNDKRYRRIVAVNHDDLPQADFIATRKIYNKYGFNASFCFILQPFFNAGHKSSMINCVKRLLHEGHEMGLHAIMNSSYWRADKMIDIRPDGGSNFAPQYSELIGHNQDKTGANDYQQSVTATTKLSDLGYAGPVNSQNIVSNLTVVSMTEEELNDVNASYNFYSSQRTLSGLDEEDTAQTKTHLAWLEYWYNLWIDSNLGNSSTASTLAARFAEDYSVPSGVTLSDYYPDAVHQFNGKMVYWNDTSNAHYSEAKLKTAAGFSENDYQLVGKFTKGLYKDCFSTSNYEVMDRVIMIAQEYARRYFGLDHFTDTHVHGVNYINIQRNIFLINNGFVVGGHGKFFRSRIGCFSSEIDLLNEFGINLIDYDTNQLLYEGQVGLYYGMDERMDTRVSSGRNESLVYIHYLNFFGNNKSENMSYSNFMTYVNGLDNWLKFAYENSEQQVTRNGLTYTVFETIKSCVDIIRASFDTGKVPVLSLDTLGANPSIVAAIGMICEYCKKNNVDIVSLSEARRIAMEGIIKNNYFPNPSFKQSLLYMFGGSCTSIDAYIPDGWRKELLGNNTLINVHDTIISDETYKTLDIIGEGIIETRIYGIPSGNYKLSFYAKGTSSFVNCWIKKNGNKWSITSVTPDFSPNITNEFALYEFNFSIKPNIKSEITETTESKICGGYEDNFSNLQIRLICSNSNSDISIYKPIIEKI